MYPYISPSYKDPGTVLYTMPLVKYSSPPGAMMSTQSPRLVYHAFSQFGAMAETDMTGGYADG